MRGRFWVEIAAGVEILVARTASKPRRDNVIPFQEGIEVAMAAAVAAALLQATCLSTS